MILHYQNHKNANWRFFVPYKYTTQAFVSYFIILYTLSLWHDSHQYLYTSLRCNYLSFDSFPLLRNDEREKNDRGAVKYGCKSKCNIVNKANNSRRNRNLPFITSCLLKVILTRNKTTNNLNYFQNHVLRILVET